MAVISVGLMTKTVRFDKNIPVPKGAGYKDVYTELLTTRGELIKKNGSRNLLTGEIVTSNFYDLNVRFQQALEDNLRTDTKIVIDGKVFTPQTWEKTGEKRFYYHFTLAEGGQYAEDGVAGGSLFVDEPLFLTNDGFDFVQSDLLIGANIKIKLVMVEDGPPLKKVNLLTSNREYKLDSNVGKIYLYQSLNVGEIVYVLYKS